MAGSGPVSLGGQRAPHRAVESGKRGGLLHHLRCKQRRCNQGAGRSQRQRCPGPNGGRSCRRPRRWPLPFGPAISGDDRSGPAGTHSHVARHGWKYSDHDLADHNRRSCRATQSVPAHIDAVRVGGWIDLTGQHLSLRGDSAFAVGTVR